MINMIIISPLQKLTKAAQELGDGNVDVTIPKISSNDEIKDMSDSLETVVGAIKFLKGKQK